MHGQKIGGVIQIPNERQFMAYQPIELVRHTIGKPRMRPAPSQFFQKLLRGEHGIEGIFRILIGQLIEREITRRQELFNIGQRLRIIGE